MRSIKYSSFVNPTKIYAYRIFSKSSILLVLLFTSLCHVNEALQFQPIQSRFGGETIRRSYHYHYSQVYSHARHYQILLSSSLSRSTSTRTSKSKISTTNLFGEKYGRGAEIYPPTNEEPIILTDSFPNGILPVSVQNIIDENKNREEEVLTTGNTTTIKNNDSSDGGKGEEHQEGGDAEEKATVQALGDKISNRARVKNAIQSILLSAAKSEQSKTTPSINPISTFFKPPPIIASALVILGLIRPNLLLTVVFVTGYLVVLGLIASSPKSADNINPIMRVLPPQGHVPPTVKNPLGQISASPGYFSWLRVGVILGYVAPIAYLIQTVLDGRKHLSETIASSIFLISCQIMTEEFSREVSSTPLPIRILIPLIYNSIRMGPLYEWIMCWPTMTRVGKLLSVANFAYWGMNLFAFLIPIAAVRYMRSYFYAVEAEEVIARKGDEDNIGLLPSSSLM